VSVLITNARIVTMDDDNPVITRGFVRTEGETIAEIGVGEPTRNTHDDETIDAAGRALLPGFVDAHTHACWAGDRLDEFDMKLAGATYLEILKAGGGIMSTVRATREATQEELADLLRARLSVMLREGTTTVEVKSGYGLTTEDELKMLRAIRDAAETSPIGVRGTALIGHAVDPDQPDFFDTTIHDTLDAVHAEFPDIAVDAYCEEGAWPLDQCMRLFLKAEGLGHSMRVHADQFNSLGMTRAAIEMNALSVDHLEATTPPDLDALAHSNVYGVMLPCSGFQLDGRYADGRDFLDTGGSLVIATNCNPGSAPTSSIPFTIALATRKLGLAAAEAIRACTRTPAEMLGLTDRGVVAPGKRADLVLLRHTDERMLGFELGGDPVDLVICAGRIVET
jgi:imidazolonepropionase